MTDEARQLTGLDNPNSVTQLKAWLGVDKLDKEAVAQLAKESEDPTVTRVLELRQAMARSSISKYDAITRCVCLDGRVRGLFQYHKASTGRWAGRLVQVQNLPRNDLKDLDVARELVREDYRDMLELVYDDPSDVLSQLIRTAFIPADGCRFIVADFSSIEARVIAWLADEEWVLDEFRGDGKIYEANAARIFHVDKARIVKGNPEYALRKKGKVATLACGYQGGEKAMEKMDTKKEIDPTEYQSIVNAWRKANPHIVEYWSSVETAALNTVQTGVPEELPYGVRFELQNKILFIRLPSGRKLAYISPRVEPNRFGGVSLTYAGVDQTSKAWGRQETYGGKLVENIVQAIARDCLRDAMLALDESGYKIVMHIHDEAVIEVSNMKICEYFSDPEICLDGCECRKYCPRLYNRDSKTVLEDVCEIMGRSLPWASGLPLRADGSEMAYYRKE